MSHGSASRLSINGTEIGFTRFRPMSVQNLVDDSSRVIDGKLDPHSGNILRGIKNVGCEILLTPGNAELKLILPFVGLAESPTNTFTSGNVVNGFPVVVNYDAAVHTYTNCKVNVAVLQGQKGSSPIRLLLQLVGDDITIGAAGSFSPSTTLLTPAPYAFTMGVATIGGTATQHNQFQLSIMNNLTIEHNNSITATCIRAGGRDITLQMSAPYSTTNLPRFATPWGGTVKSTGSLAFTNGGTSSTATFGELNAIARPPAIITKMTECRLPLTYKVGRTDSAAAITWVNVNA